VDGTGQFCTLQGAITAANPGADILVASGAYYGIVYFKDKDGLSIIGDDRETTVIAGVNNNNLNPSTRGRALVGLENVSDFLIESVTIENQTPQGGSQAEALAMLSCDQCIVRDATVRSLQDTLLWSGKIYAEDCLIEGNVDYIWGTGTAYFNRCEIRTVGRKGYNLQARNGSNYGYVFVDSQLTADPGITDDILARIDVTQYPMSHVAYIDCEMGSHIAPVGWTITGGGSTANLRFWEYKSRTPQGVLVNTSSRAAGSRQISDAEAAQMRDPTFVFGGWDPNP
jgi:pectin methylesterase-like acyl-CoA thioesterase